WVRSVRSSNAKVVVMSNGDSKNCKRTRPNSAATSDTANAHPTDVPMARSVSSSGPTWKNHDVPAAITAAAVAEKTAALRNALRVETDETNGIGAIVAISEYTVTPGSRVPTAARIAIDSAMSTAMRESKSTAVMSPKA